MAGLRSAIKYVYCVLAFFLCDPTHFAASFDRQETNWENVRCLRNGETVSVDGTHLGHNLPDGKGNRYCINLVSVAGRPIETTK
jgi:peptide methionine sulfoxide reductase MsrB